MSDRVIYKYEIEAVSITAMTLPAGAKILTLGEQDGAIVLWAEVDPFADEVSRLLTVVPTGGGVPFGEYIGTFQIGGYVGHAYLEPELPQ